jgi:syringomycin synthetase protein SyrE
VDSAPHGRSRKPSGDLERQLLAIWCEALNLGQDDLNVNDNFFDFGGDSLAAVAILAGIEKTLGIKLALHQIVETPTVAGMAEMLSDQMGLPSLLISLGTTSRDTTLYLAASGHGDLLRFRALAQAMEGACDLHMLQPPGYAENPSLTELANLYADRIEARGDHTVFVAGFSVGGLAALETARQLRQRGFEVTSLFLVDTVLAKLPWFGFVIWDALAWLARRTRIFNYDINGRRLATTLNDVGLYSQVRAMRRYKPDRFDGKTLLVKSSALTHWDRWLFSPWRRIIPHLEEQVMLGMHGTLFEPGKIDTLAQILSDHIRMNYSEG